MRLRKIWIAAIVAVACGSDERVGGGIGSGARVAPAKASFTFVASTDPTRKPDIITEDGSRFIWQRTTIPAPIPNTFMLAAGGEARRQTPMEEMTLEELAEAIRPRLQYLGEEYLLDHAPIEAASRVRAKIVEPTELPGATAGAGSC